jgi:hypothetical protein
MKKIDIRVKATIVALGVAKRDVYIYKHNGIVAKKLG